MTTTRAAAVLAIGILAGSIVVTTVDAESASLASSLAPSIRTAGTGGAGGAAFWGGDPDAWANPALLGYHQGVRFDAGRTEFGTAAGLAFQTARWSAAFGGVGVMGTGTPGRLSRTEFADDRLAGTPGRTAQRIDAWGAGLSLAQAISSVMALWDAAPPSLFQRLDVAVGTMRRQVGVEVAPDPETSTRVSDYGVMVRWTPTNTLDPRRVAAPAAPPPGTWRWPQANDPARTRRARDPRAGFFADLRPPRPMEHKRYDLAYGFSVQNAARGAIEHLDGSSEPLARIVRHGASASLATGVPRRFGASSWLTRAFTPMYAAGIVGDLEKVEPGDGTGRHDIERYGVEATYANVLTLRHGHVRDAATGIDGTTFGYSLGFDFGTAAGVRYDRARVPQAKGLADLERRGFTAWVDPLVMLRAARGGSPKRQ